MTRCKYNMGDCSTKDPDREACFNCMVSVIKIALDGTIKHSNNPMKVGYYVNMALTMNRGLAHWGQDDGMKVDAYKEKPQPVSLPDADDTVPRYVR